MILVLVKTLNIFTQMKDFEKFAVKKYLPLMGFTPS